MLPLEHSAILLICIKRQLVFLNCVVLLYNQQSIYIYAYTCLCQCVGKYTTQMSTVVSLICLGPSFQKMTHHFLLHGSLRPTNLQKKIWSPDCYNAFTGSGTGQETCKQYRSECHGASKFHGVRCKDKLCQCDVEDACDNYYSMSVYGKYSMSVYGKY